MCEVKIYLRKINPFKIYLPDRVNCDEKTSYKYTWKSEIRQNVADKNNFTKHLDKIFSGIFYGNKIVKYPLL